MKPAAFVVFGLGVFVCALNFYLSVVRHLLFRLAGRQTEYRHISGFPLVGSAAVLVVLTSVQAPRWVWIPGIVFALLDTGGLHWFLAVLVLHHVKSNAIQERKS